MCVASEGLLTHHISKRSLIAAIGGTIEDYRLNHKETTVGDIKNLTFRSVKQSVLRIHSMRTFIRNVT